MSQATTSSDTSKAFFSRTGGVGWASLAAIGGCAALCSLPLLTALLGGGAAATALASLASPGTELFVAGTAFLAVLGVVEMRRRKRRSKSPAKAAAGNQALATNAVPVACDPFVFSSDERSAHHALAKDVILRLPSRREELSDGFRFHYQGDEELFLTLARWASSERRCCAWASFSVEMDPGPCNEPFAIRLSMRGGVEGKALLEEAFGLLESDPRAQLFLEPTGTITKERFASAKTSGGCGC